MILLTADWHIKLNQKNVPKDWAVNRYKLFFEQLKDLEAKASLHIIAGDIFDKLPSMEELEIYFKFIKQCGIKTLITTGNHEATKKGKTFLTQLKEVTNDVNPLVEIIDYIHETDKFIIVPYEFISKEKTWQSLDKSKAIFSHIRGEIEPHVKSEIPLEWIEDFDVVYLGDLHSHSNCQRNMVYPGSPMVTSFHRSRVSTGYILIDDTDLTKWAWEEFDLPQLLRKTVSNEADMIPTSPDHTIYELEGDVVDLSNVKTNELLDKKLVKRSTDTSLILSKDMTIQDELVEYLTFVLELPEDKIQEAVSTFNDYAKDIGVE